MPSSVERFLDGVHEANTFSGLRMGDKVVPLYLSFWTPDEIADGRGIKADWDVPEDLVPFYGDWHDLACISVATGEVSLLNEDRDTVFLWRSGEEFLGCLTTHPEVENGSPNERTPKLTSFSISDDLDAAIRKMIEEDAHKK